MPGLSLFSSLALILPKMSPIKDPLSKRKTQRAIPTGKRPLSPIEQVHQLLTQSHHKIKSLHQVHPQ